MTTIDNKIIGGIIIFSSGILFGQFTYNLILRKLAQKSKEPFYDKFMHLITEMTADGHEKEALEIYTLFIEKFPEYVEKE